jgi:nucleoside-diphosphate-sugar epimerase
MVGRHIAEALTAAGSAVSVISRGPPVLSIGARAWYEWDVTGALDLSRLGLADAGIDAVIHAAAAVPGTDPVSPLTLFEANVGMTARIGCWAAERALPVVFLSGAIVYEDSIDDGITETFPVAPVGFGGFYRTTKLLAEETLRGLGPLAENLIILRPTSIYGARLAHDKMLSRFAGKAAAGDTIKVAPPWDDTINLVHAADVAAAAIAGLEVGASGIFNIGGGLYTVPEIADACVAAAGIGSVKKRGEDQQSGAPKIRFGVDHAKAGHAFGYYPRVDLQTGIKMMLSGALRPMDSH